VTKLCIFYHRELQAKVFAEERDDYFFQIGLEVRFSNAIFGQIRQKAVGLNWARA
jgi:hypothetical protein